MKLISRDELFEMRKNANIISRIQLTTDTELRLLDSLTDEDNAGLVILLNKINNQGIESFDVKARRYICNGQKLGFSSLCTAERVFLIAYASAKSGINICLDYGLRQLSSKTMNLFVREFYKYDSIYLVCDDVLKACIRYDGGGLVA